MIELLGILEVGDDIGVGDGVAVDEDVEQVADRNEIGDFERVAVVDEELHEDFQRRPLPLEDAGDGDERLDQCRREGIDLAEDLLVAVLREEGVDDARADVCCALEGGVDLGPGRFALWAEDPLLGNHREIAVGEFDLAKAVFVPLHELAVVGLARAGHALPHELTEIALAGDEARDRHGAVGVLRLDELGELRRLDFEEGVVAGMGGEPEHELVEEEDEAVVAEIAGMAREDRQAVVDADIFREHLPRRGVVFAEPAGQRDVFGGGGHGRRRGIEAFRGPFGGQLAPARVRGAALVEGGEELLVAVVGPFLIGLGDKRRRLVHQRQPDPRLRPAEEVDIALEHAILERPGADHVIGDEEKLLPGHPVVVLLNDRGELGDPPGLRVAGEDQVEHRHEVALPRAEAAVEVGAVARARMEAVADDAEGLIERLHKLVGDNVIPEGGLGVEDPLGKPEDKPVGGKRLGDLDQVAEECHGGAGRGGADQKAKRSVILRHAPPP